MAEPLTVGVEEEYLLADAGSGALVPRSAEAVAAAHAVLGDSVTSELNLCQIEVATGVWTRLDDLGTDLERLRRQLAEACRPLHLAPMATGTHPFSPWQSQEVDRSIDRYARMEDRFQIVARQQVICGCHVHVGIEDPALRIEVMNRARPWMPLVLALSANSPYWQGADTGYASYRTQVWQRWPTAGMPPALDGPGAYQQLVDALVGSGAIEDATHLYWYIRPSARYPTLEFRISDVCLDPAQAVTLAGFVRAVVWTCAAEARAGSGPLAPPGWAGGASEEYRLRTAVWQAARYGLEGPLIHPGTGRPAPAADVVRAALTALAPGLEAHGDGAQVEAGVERLLAQGNGATWQRQVTAAYGCQALALQVAARTACGSVSVSAPRLRAG